MVTLIIYCCKDSRKRALSGKLFIQMPKSVDEKRNRILDAAKRRFAHYGLAKTTMAEIAKDLAFSKALLYYYYPDKTSLYIAVIEDITDDMHGDIKKGIDSTSTAIDAIFVFLKKRIKYLKRYYYIIENTAFTRKEVSSDISLLLIKALEEQLELIKYIFERSVKSGEFKEMNIEENSNIFFNACMGMRFTVLNRINFYLVPDKEEFDSVLDLQLKFAQVFIKGLKA